MAAFLEGRGPRERALFRRFADLVAACGPFEFAPARGRIGFQVRTIFAAVNRLGERGLTAHVCAARRIDSPRFTRIEALAPDCFVHHFRATSPEDLDETVLGWLREAYAWGSAGGGAAVTRGAARGRG